MDWDGWVEGRPQSQGQSRDVAGGSRAALAVPSPLCPRRVALASFRGVTAFAELEVATVVVSPGGEATTTLTVRNNTDIVEAYEFEVVGECASWVTVEPTRLSLYPGTQDTVTLVLRPPLSSDTHAGEHPLAVRVVPVERPDLVSVPEMTVVITPFHRIRASLTPQRRRAWRTGRYRVALHNQGNTTATVPLSVTDPAEQLHFRLDSTRPVLEPDQHVELLLRSRAGGLIWFGAPISNPFVLTACSEGEEEDTPPPEELDGELVQLPLLPRWLLALLALLLALLLAWFALVRPSVETAAKEAAAQKARQMADEGELAPPPEAEPPPPEPKPEPQKPSGQQPGQSPLGVAVNGNQHSTSIEVRTNPGGTGSESYVVPENKVFYVTDLVLANFQGDEGTLTIESNDRTITTIALETFRNQDYHWVTPIEIPSTGEVSATVRCARPGTPPSGQQAGQCVQQLNVSGVLGDSVR